MTYEFTAPTKDPADILDHAMSFTAWLDEGETIAERTVVSGNEDLTISQVADVEGVVSWRVSGGTGPGPSDCLVSVRVTTSTGRRIERTVRYRVQDR